MKHDVAPICEVGYFLQKIQVIEHGVRGVRH